MHPRPTRSSPGASQSEVMPARRLRTNASSRLASSSSSRRARARKRRERLQADAAARERPRPGDEPVDEERRGDVAVLRDHDLPVLLGRARACGGRGRAGRCPSAAGSGPGRERSRREAARAGGRGACARPRRRSGEARAARAPARGRRAAIPSTARGRRGSRGRTRRGSAAPDASRASSPSAPSAPSQLRAGTNLAPAVCERQTLDDGAPTRPACAARPIPDEPRAAVLELELRSAEELEQLRARAGLLARELGDPFSLFREVGLLAERGELPLQLRDATRPVQPRIREVVLRAHEVERRAHERRLHDAPASDGAHEVIGAEALDARPEPEVRRRRPLRLEPSRPLERLRHRERSTCEQELARERRPVELAKRQQAHASTIVRRCTSPGTRVLRRLSSRRQAFAAAARNRDARPCGSRSSFSCSPSQACWRSTSSRRRRRMQRSQRRLVTRPTVLRPRRRSRSRSSRTAGSFVSSRTVPRRTSAAEFALRELTQGPTKAERRRGIRTALPEGVRLRSLRPDGDSWLASFSRSTFAHGSADDEADAPVADRGHARSARGRGVGGGRRGGSLPDERPARGSPRRLERRERRAGLPLLASAGSSSGSRTLGYLNGSDVTGSDDYLTEQALLAFQGWEDLDRTGTVTGQTQVALFKASRPTAGGATSWTAHRDLPRQGSPAHDRARRGRTRRPHVHGLARADARPATSTCTRSRSTRGPSPSTCGCRTPRTSAAGSRCTSRRTSPRIRPRTAASGCPTARPTASTASSTSARPSSCADDPGGERGTTTRLRSSRLQGFSTRPEIPRQRISGLREELCGPLKITSSETVS